MPLTFSKITSQNGFDYRDSDNAKQNNYAWSMAEMNEYIYVGTGRNIFYNVVGASFKRFGIPIEMPKEFTPKNQDDRAEIWRYNKSMPQKGWELVFKAPNGVDGFRFMIPYTTPSGETAIYAGGNTRDKVKVFKSRDGGLNSWYELSNDSFVGNTTRAMVVHGGKLYIATLNDIGGESGAYIFSSIDPENRGWQLVTPKGGDSNRNITKGIVNMISFNDHLYAATGGEEGFELWRTLGSEPQKDNWKLLIDKGAGDATNIGPLTLGAFRDHLYVGAIAFPFTDKIRLTGFKPFDLIRIDTMDNWELVIGGHPIKSTSPNTGRRGEPLSGKMSGLGNLTNLYCWQLQAYDDEFYLGTFDWSVVIEPMLYSILAWAIGFYNRLQYSFAKEFLREILIRITRFVSANPNLFNSTEGFDLYRSKDGVSWTPITLNGFGNPHNYGARNLLPSTDGHLYVGTANPFDGCEVWLIENR